MKQVQEYWPGALKDIEEFKQIANVLNPELELLWESIDNLIDDQFIETATDRGIARREKMLKISAFADDTLDTRRFRVLNRWGDQLPYTYKVLVNKLTQLCGEDGYTINLNAGQYALNIKIELTKKRMFDEVQLIARRTVPANIVVKVELRYNQYFTVAKLTHRKLSALIYKKIREEEL